MRLVINTSHEQGRLELSQTSCNRATWYASPHKSHQLTGPSYISSSSLTKSLPSFLLSLSSHTVGTHKSALHSSQGEREVLFFISEGFPPVFSRGSGGREWGCSFPHIPVWHLHCARRKHSRSAVQTAFWRVWILTGRHISKHLLCISQRLSHQVHWFETIWWKVTGFCESVCDFHWLLGSDSICVKGCRGLVLCRSLIPQWLQCSSAEKTYEKFTLNIYKA